MTKTPTPKKPIWLQISETLSLPLKTVTSTVAILGKKRSGKSYKGSVLAEEMLERGQQIIVLDPTSAWWGLRSSADGKRPGYPVTIFGGEHGDLPLEVEAAENIADAIVSDGFSAILDLSDFTKGGETRFCGAFLERLYRNNRRAKRAMHLFMDEADVYAPQRATGDEMRTLGACQSIVLRGGITGLGITMITQRPARLNKDVLSQIDMLICLKMNHPADLDQVDDWMKRHDTKGVRKEMQASLPTLAKGDAWVWDPSSEVFERVTFRERRTYDSGRTPEVGESVLGPKVLAAVDLERLGETIRSAVTRAKENDPKELKKKIAELETKLKVTSAVGSPAQSVVAEMQRLAGERDELLADLVRARSWNDRLEDINERLVNRTDKTLDKLGKVIETLQALDSDLTDARNEYGEALQNAVDDEDKAHPPKKPKTIIPPKAGKKKPPMMSGADAFAGGPKATVNGTTKMIPMERAFLTALAQHGRMSKGKVLTYTGYAQGGATSRAFAHLTREGWIVTTVDAVQITEEGSVALGPYEPLPTGRALREKISAELGPMEQSFFITICDAYPETISKGRILELTGYAQGGATSRAFAYLSGRDWIKSTGGGHVIAAQELFT